MAYCSSSGRALALSLGVATLLSLGIARPAAAQETGTVRGRVVDAGSRQPLSDVQVTVSGTALGAVTGTAGEYSISGVPAGAQRVRARRLGYAAREEVVTMLAGGVVRVDFGLSAVPVELDAVVVTGTPGATERRRVANDVTQVNVDEVTDKTTVTSVTEVLQARAPGVEILPNAGTPGAAADIRIRGASSFIGNAPIVLVDGVRYNTESLGNFAPSGAGLTSYSAQVTSALNGINPNDIESIEVIKGPAAATLYGAEAAGGVIQIITKRGLRGQQQTQWTARLERGWTELALPIPTNYTTCDSAKLANSAVWPGCAGQALGTILTDNPLRRDPNALRTGDLQRADLSVRGGGDRYSYFLSGAFGREEGVFLNSYNRTRSVRANISFSPSDVLSLQLNTSYYQDRLRLPIGDESAQGLLLSASRGAPGRVPPGNNPESLGWATLNPIQSNAYNNLTDTDRLTLSGTIAFTPFSWMRNRLVLGLDQSTGLAQLLSEPNSVDVPQGLSAQRVPRSHIYTIDYAGSLVAPLRRDLEATTSVGAQVTAKQYQSLFASGTGLGAPDVTVIQSAATIGAANAFTENNSVGYYLQEQLAWRNRLFVTGALRADDNSSFGANFNLITYPKASLSWVLSEEPALSRVFRSLRANEFRVRTAWGAAGRAPDPYSATQTYTVDKVTLGTTTGSALRTATLGNPNLKPERGTELEAGFDASFFGSRLGANVTYYDKQMEDLIIPVALPGSGGFPGSRLENLGTTENTGLELMLTGTPVQRELFTWTSRLTLATNHNTLVSFGDTSRKKDVPYQPYSPSVANQQNRPGYPLAGYWGAFPQRDANGQPLLNSSGTAALLDTSVYIGPSAPTREVGFSNTITFLRYFSLYALVDYKGGNYLLNYKEYNRCRFNSNCQLVNDPSASDLTKILYRTVPALYIEKADFVKLRDLSLTAMLPRSWIARTGASSASITLAGRNLALWSDYSGIDPEVNTYGNRSLVRVDAYAAPMNRRISIALNLTY